MRCVNLQGTVYMRIWGKYGGKELYTTAWSTF